MIDMELLKKLIRLVEESGIDSLEVERFATRIRIRKSPVVGAGPVIASAPAALSTPTGPSSDVALSGATATDASALAAHAPGGDSDLHDILSPMVGTFYRAPSPDAPPYVDVGDRVEKGQTLCILEAMKLMNELEAEVAGVVREVTVENAEPVEYGQLLFRVEPDAAA
jgi:acetyl-CoA carboxylase biotin carboxyl carrier protein